MDRAALITGGSSGIGLAIARVLGEEGYGLTLSARAGPTSSRPRPRGCAPTGFDVLAVAANVTDEEAIKDVVAQHRERWGRLDVLINNAGLGIGATVADMETKKLDLQLDVNLRAVYLVARESIPLLKEAGAEHGKALMVNTASIAGKQGQAFLSAYSATKFGVVGLSQALHRELMGDGVQVTALCPAFVATPMTDWVEGQVPKDQMIQPEDIAESVRFLLKVSPACIVPEIQFLRRGDAQL